MSAASPNWPIIDLRNYGLAAGGRHQKGGRDRRHRSVANRPKTVSVRHAATFAVMRGSLAICGDNCFRDGPMGGRLERACRTG
jgi:hypothetical protein